MTTMGRREVLKLGGALAAGASAAPALAGQAATDPDELTRLQQTVNFIYDGSHLSPLEYAHLLNQLATSKPLQADVYSNGGVVEELEHTLARWLGQGKRRLHAHRHAGQPHRAAGTAGVQRRVLVQAESHIYNDSGDCAQQLSGLNLIPWRRGESASRYRRCRTRCGAAAPAG